MVLDVELDARRGIQEGSVGHLLLGNRHHRQAEEVERVLGENTSVSLVNSDPCDSLESWTVVNEESRKVSLIFGSALRPRFSNPGNRVPRSSLTDYLHVELPASVDEGLVASVVGSGDP